jgi:hypothetical protein
MSVPTVLISHLVSVASDGTLSDALPGQLLSAAVIRRALAILIAQGATRYDDGRFHGQCSDFAAYDLLRDTSCHDAIESGFEILPTKANSPRQVIAHGTRWEVSSRFKEAKLFGPNSDPDNILRIDLIRSDSSSEGVA